MKLWPFKPKAASVENPSTPLSQPAQWLVDLLGGGDSNAGIAITEESVMRSSTVYACVGLISQSIASLPLNVYERVQDARRLAAEHPVHSLLHDTPNPNMTAVVFRELMMTSLLLHGNSYNAIGRDHAGRPLDLYPLRPNRVSVERQSGRLRYIVQLENGGLEVLDQDNVLHVPGPGFDGVVGLSPISFAMREAVGLALATEEHGARLFSNGARPSGILKSKKALSEEARQRLKDQWQAAQGGLTNTGKTALLEEELEWQQISIKPDDAQFLETRKFQVEEIARIFRVPLILLSHHEKSTSWGSGIEQQSIGFVVYTLRPWLTRIEQEINRKLFGSAEKNYYAEHKVTGLLRGDAKSRAEYYASAIQNSWMTPNEVRRLENMDPIDGGDELLVQQNMTPTKKLGEEETNA